MTTAYRHAPAAPAPVHRFDLSTEQRQRILSAAREAGVAPEPWWAWADVAAMGRGPDAATRAACFGAALEPYFAGPPDDVINLELPPPRWREALDRASARLRRR